MISYPDFQVEFINAFFNQEKEAFIKMAMDYLKDQKHSRKERFAHNPYFTYRLDPGHLNFLKTKDPLTNTDVPLKTLELLFSMSPHDPDFVCKSYYYLDRLVHYVKDEGADEIRDFYNKNPSFFQEIFSNLSVNLILNIGLDHDKDNFLAEFEQNKESSYEYCRKYRECSFAAFALWNQDRF